MGALPAGERVRVFTRREPKLFGDVAAYDTCNAQPALQHVKRLRDDLPLRRGMRLVELFVENPGVLRKQNLREFEFAGCRESSSIWDARSLVSTVVVGPHRGEQVREVRNLLLQAGNQGVGRAHFRGQVCLQRADLICFVGNLVSQVREGIADGSICRWSRPVVEAVMLERAAFALFRNPPLVSPPRKPNTSDNDDDAAALSNT